MGYTIKENVVVAIKAEVTEGTYAAPSAGADFIQSLSAGTSWEPTKELLERDVLNSSLGKSTPRTGMRSVAAALPVEFKAHGTAGQAPEYGLLLESLLGAKRNSVSVTTKSSGNTNDDLQIEDADIGNFAVGDIVLVKQSGAYHVSPIVEVDATSGAAKIVLLVPKATGNFSNSVVIEAFTTYYPADEGHKSISVTRYLEDAIRQKAVGCKVTSASIDNFSTGQLASWNFSLEGMSYDEEVSALALTPAYDSALPPLILGACVRQDGSLIPVNSVSLSIENELGPITSTCSENGKIAQRITNRTITGSIDPYKEDDDISDFTRFNEGVTFSLFFFAKVDTGVAGEFGDVVAVYLPNCLITSYGEADQNGVIQQTLSFRADRGSQGNEDEVFIGFV